MTGYHLAQVNIARVRAPLDSSAPDDLVAGLAPAADTGDGQPGFVWRRTPGPSATAVHTFRLGSAAQLTAIVNLTVWESVDALADFVLRQGHGAFLRHRRDWFHPTDRATNALWWVPVGHEPGAEEAEERVRHLRTHGPTATAFTLRLTFPPPDRRISLVPGGGARVAAAPAGGEPAGPPAARSLATGG
ncbi:conserved hypothetical protein [Frankia canadensis]|uniref:DUF3291 domain-containing protein n=1 Tax=Frankia canadensis TaxID=1836972 RepID=A0A2I2KVH2_9ACTN|nr:DUF3291 domain-containing protein [Frankia canadensis]SNQ49660.1 conserved hypothetical protein [Frankia canadensis]SOU56950.1 conserved hypothetical protein [Frankia canadensis]